VARLHLTAHIDAPVDRVYHIVADVEQYPAFLPDVLRVEKSGDVVAMTLRMAVVPVRLVTRATFMPSESIDLELLEGPFRSFHARWTFTPGGGGTDVAYHADYELPVFGLLLAGAAGHVLEQATQKQIRAFAARVRALAEA
jgi:ribosome-associated toxin RatA of RatAB toxin-antitoxin module